MPAVLYKFPVQETQRSIFCQNVRDAFLGYDGRIGCSLATNDSVCLLGRAIKTKWDAENNKVALITDIVVDGEKLVIDIYPDYLFDKLMCGIDPPLSDCTQHFVVSTAFIDM